MAELGLGLVKKKPSQAQVSFSKLDLLTSLLLLLLSLLRIAIREFSLTIFNSSFNRDISISIVEG